MCAGCLHKPRQVWIKILERTPDNMLSRLARRTHLAVHTAFSPIHSCHFHRESLGLKQRLSSLHSSAVPPASRIYLGQLEAYKIRSPLYHGLLPLCWVYANVV